MVVAIWREVGEEERRHTSLLARDEIETVPRPALRFPLEPLDKRD